ncbi:MAG: glycoside hydrolase family 2 TIM barrel-domain containing protein [Verrucomicrobiota bacterium]
MTPPHRSFIFLLAALAASSAFARESRNFNRDWKYSLGDPAGAGAASFDDSAWSGVHLPHTFSLPYFLWPQFYTGYGWYRKHLKMPANLAGKRVELEFEGAFQDAEIFVNGTLAGRHKGGYVGFPVDLTSCLKPGDNVIAVRLNNLWRADLAPRAGDHTFSGGLYRDVNLVVKDPLHVAWNGTFVTTPTLEANKGASSTANIKTEVRNDSATPRKATVRTDILDAKGVKVATATSALLVPAKETVTFDQTTPPVVRPKLWSPEEPNLYQAVTTLLDGTTITDTYETTFGFRCVNWTADRGFFLNGKHVWLSGADVHQDQAGWGDAVTNSAHERDVKMVKEAGFNFIRGSHYPKDPAFALACDRHGVLWLSENIFWGIGGKHSDGGWSASAYPVTPADEAVFEQSVLDSLQAMIRIHRNSPSIIGWSVSNEAFFSDSPIEKVRGLLKRSVDLAHKLDPSRAAGVGGAQRPLNDSRIDKIGDFAGYNGDGATQPAFQNPGVPSVVSEYGSVVADRPGKFDPGWGDLNAQLTNGRPTRFPWRSGEAVWCMYDHGSHAGLNLARMGIVDYSRLPKRAFYWYRKNYAGVPAPKWPVEGKPAKIDLTADKTTIAKADGTDDVQITVSLLGGAGERVNAEVPVTLTVVSGPGEFPTGPSITFTPPGKGEASDIAIREGQAAIAFRSYFGGETILRAESPGLPDSTLKIRTLGEPGFKPGTTPDVPVRPYARFSRSAPEKVEKTDNAAVLALNRPTKASSSAPGAPSGQANDGDLSTAWRAAPNASGEVAWEVFLEVAYDVDRIELTFSDAVTLRYIVEVTSDGSQWNIVVDQSDSKEVEKRRVATGNFGKAVTGVRVRFRAGPGAPVPALAEVCVGGAPKVDFPEKRLSGTIIGTPGSYHNDPHSTREAAFDGAFDTYFDAPFTDNAWLGLDLGPRRACKVAAIAYAPRFEEGNTKFPGLMVGGKFQGANKPDFSDAADIHVVEIEPKPRTFTTQILPSPVGPFRYLRYLAPAKASGNVSEIRFLAPATR